MADDKEKSLNKQKQIYQEQVDLAKELSKIVNDTTLSQMGLNKLSHTGYDIAVQLLGKLEDRVDYDTAITDINKTINDLLLEQVQTGTDINDGLIEQLDNTRKVLKLEKERKGASEEIKSIGKDFAKDLGTALGLSSELVDAIMKMSVVAIGLYIFKEILGFITDAVGRMKDLTKETGASVSQAMQLEFSIRQAQLSLNPLLYSFEEVAESAKALREQTGQIVPDPKLLEDITRVNALLKDPAAATSLTRTLQNANIDAGNLTDNIKKLASSMNVDAGAAMEFLAENQLELGGMTEEQIMLRAEEALTLKKMGADMKELNRLAGEALDIETSLKNEMKLRMMTGKEINLNELRAAQASGDAVAIGHAQAKLVEQLGDDLHNNLQVQRMISDATGMSREQLLNYNNASKESKKEQEELLAIKEKHGLADLEQAKQFKLNAAVNEADMKNMLIITGVVLGSLTGISVLIYMLGPLMGKMLKKLPGGDDPKNNPIANFIKGLGTKEVLMGATAMLVVSASMFVMAKALTSMPTDPAQYIGMAVGLTMLVGALYAISKLPTKDLIAGSIAMGIMGAALIPFAFAMSMIADVEIENVLAVAAGIALFTGEILLLGALMFSGIGAMVFGAGILALISLGGALLMLGSGLQSVSGKFAGITDDLTSFVTSISQIQPAITDISTTLKGLGSVADPLNQLAMSMFILSGGLSALAISGALASPVIGSLLLLAASAPALAKLGSMFGFGGDSESGVESKTESKSDMNMSELLTEVKGLRQDIQSQPIMINVDGRVVSKITRLQKQQNSVSTTGYGG